jgi:hypothetical protein
MDTGSFPSRAKLRRTFRPRTSPSYLQRTRTAHSYALAYAQAWRTRRRSRSAADAAARERQRVQCVRTAQRTQRGVLEIPRGNGTRRRSGPIGARLEVQCGVGARTRREAQCCYTLGLLRRRLFRVFRLLRAGPAEAPLSRARQTAVALCKPSPGRAGPWARDGLRRLGRARLQRRPASTVTGSL